MFSITLLCMGKLKEKFYTAAAEEYSKRLRAFADFRIVELPEYRLPDDPNETQIAQGLAREAEAIRKAIPKGAWLCVLTPEGRLLSSEELASALHGVKTGGQDLHDGIGRHALAGAGFAHDAEHFARVEIERHAVDGVDLAGIGKEGGVQILHAQKMFTHIDHLFSFGSKASRRPSPSRLRLSTIRQIVSAGNTSLYG